MQRGKSATQLRSKEGLIVKRLLVEIPDSADPAPLYRALAEIAHKTGTAIERPEVDIPKRTTFYRLTPRYQTQEAA